MQMNWERLSGILKTIGPGILFAGAAIGGSHLVQSTRAGASYGFSLVWIVVLVLLFKYPFFEFSHRYTTATSESLLRGYTRVGRWALIAFMALAVLAAITNAAAVTLVTAALAGNLFRLDLPPVYLSAMVIGVIVLILLMGKYPFLDKIIKLQIAILGVATIIAVIIAAVHGPVGAPNFPRSEIWSLAGVSFLLALMGWMPAPIDVSVWPSLWGLERSRQTNHAPRMSEALIDFHIGYILTSILAFAFLALGALVMFGTGEQFSNSSITFASQLISLYTLTLGKWSWFLISLVAFLTMFSTCLTVSDGYTRTLKGCIELLAGENRTFPFLYWALLSSLSAVALIIIGFFLSGIKSLVDLATILAFLAAPILALLNYLAVNNKVMPREFLPSLPMKILSWAGILFLTGFSLIYIYFKFIMK